MKKVKSKSRSSEKGGRIKNQQANKTVFDRKYADVLGLGIIIFLGIIIYSNSFSCSFHLDDINRIINNAAIRDIHDLKTIWHYDQSRFIPYYTFALNYHFDELNVWGYHLFNLVIHLINACLVYWFTIMIFSSPAMKDQGISTDKKAIAFLTALLFISHPLATQSVTYIVQRMTTMMAMFYLLSLALYLKARLVENSNSAKYALFAGAFASAVCALLSKENAFTLPFAIMLVEIFLLSAQNRVLIIKNSRLIIFSGTLLLMIFLASLKYSLSIFKPIPPSEVHPEALTPLNYLFTQFSVIVKYIQLLFLPVNQNLDYDFPIANSVFEGHTLVSLALLVSLIIFAISIFRKYRIISFGIFWFFIALSVESSIIPINDVIFEHRTYLPSVGFFLALSSGIYLLFGRKNKYFPISILVLIIGINSILTFERNKVWKDDFTMWNDVVSKSPNKARPHGIRGLIYSKLEQWDKGIADLSRAIEIYPQYFVANYNLGIAFGNLRQWPKAISNYSRAIEINPEYLQAYYNRGNSYNNLRQWDNAIADFTRSIEIDSGFYKAYLNRGIAYESIGQPEKAMADFSASIRINPKYTEGNYNLGRIYEGLKQFDNAINEYTKAIEIDPKYINAYINRGNIYGGLSQWDKALADYSSAIGINPRMATAYYNRGAAYNNLRQWDKSIPDFTTAIEIDPNFTAAYAARDLAYRKLNDRKTQ